ncbi:DUF1329 domain-containing protein [Aromatoleum petrolei]|uniref:DUF1329 domain-containing protein n=1 Tax=Aromatoleum petrolei TaxID=76116 RepID=A0ABX1N078_9RHOO|nr:DUF1329 domain-containing protein [Aromatoleum petrolei]NMF90837.1 DUF1329 domain-containing protein [Aromatoleum petrolei]QTQ34576.1 putative protein DUF1329 [Aromatoleum petrolei]
MKALRTTGLLTLALAAGAALAAAPQDADRLGKDLTPLGGEKAANKDNSIPGWQDGGALSPGWAYGKPRGNFFKYKDDKPLYTIDGSNADKYADKLGEGQRALLKTLKNYRMDVYPTHRHCSAPDFVQDSTRKNITAAKLGSDGWSLAEAVVPGVPFPVPTSGIEVLWNAKMKYAGVGITLPAQWTMLSPRASGGDWIEAKSTQTYYYPWGRKGAKKLSELPPVEYNTYFAYASPTALAGQALLVTSYTDKTGDTFYYFPGQRRVRRMPSYSYDAPQIGFENQYTMDEPRVFNGPADRFDWKLIGKKEMYVAYNAFGMYDPAADRHKVVTPEGVDAKAARYELHRVWVVEATAKSGVRHVAPKRRFYFDEDSWALMGAEDYDAQGKLWKVRESFLIPVAETGTCDNPAFVQYDLASGRVLYDQGSLGAGQDMAWATEPNDPKYRDDFYTPDNLRAISDR